MNHFFGQLQLSDKPITMTFKQFLPRGAKLQNTQWIIGIVAYTGPETKIMLNSGERIFKQSKLIKNMNIYLIGLIIFELLLCIITVIGSSSWNANNN